MPRAINWSRVQLSSTAQFYDLIQGVNLRETVQPHNPHLFTEQELENYKSIAIRGYGKLTLGVASIVTLCVSSLSENMPTAIVGGAFACYGLLAGTFTTEKLVVMEVEANKRPQAESLPLEFPIDN